MYLRDWSAQFVCYHTEIETADEASCVPRSQHSDTGLRSQHWSHTATRVSKFKSLTLLGVAGSNPLSPALGVAAFPQGHPGGRARWPCNTHPCDLEHIYSWSIQDHATLTHVIYSTSIHGLYRTMQHSPMWSRAHLFMVYTGPCNTHPCDLEHIYSWSIQDHAILTHVI